MLANTDNPTCNECDILVVFVVIPTKLPIRAEPMINKGFSIIGKWKCGCNCSAAAPRKGSKISLIVPIAIAENIPTNKARTKFFLYL